VTGTELDPTAIEAVMDTDQGEMVISFLPDKAPKTVENFVSLVQKGFYDGLVFHRIIKGFMVQCGCPRGDGTGGPGYKVKAEFNDTPHKRGVLSMARSAHPDSAGSQFFIVHGAHARHLDGQYTAFGQVTSGLDVLDAIANAPCDFGGGGERSKPMKPCKIKSMAIRPKTATSPAEPADSDEDGEEQEA
jgi:peptidyl-prolyl cis-trans isomerase B (cyclophilin B)